jgi:hypothetical protein
MPVIINNHRIGRINTARIETGHYDRQMRLSIESFNTNPPPLIKKEDVTQYIRPVSLSLLEATNVSLYLNPKGVMECRNKNDPNPHYNEILFSKISKEVLTDASFCAS